MPNRPAYTAADAERDRRALQRDPAAQAYGDHLRRQGMIPAATPAAVLTPGAVAVSREIRTAQLARYRL